MWYSNLYRRHLLDMHIEDWDPVFLSAFSPETYVNNLLAAKINYAMIYFQSHAGLCYFPTETGTMHAAFRDDPSKIRRTVDLCRENGIRVCGYYSLIYNTREHDKHPEWRLLMQDGQSMRAANAAIASPTPSQAKGGRYGFVCPNHPEYRAFVRKQIDEMLAYFDFDAFFFDMPFWPHTCYCGHCRKKYEALTGHPMPDSIPDRSPEYFVLLDYKYRAMGEFIQSVTDYVKSRRPDMPVEHNYACSVAGESGNGCGEGVGDACDYVGGDLYGNLYNHSFACKYFRAASRNQPFEQMFSRCKPALSSHTLTKSRDEMKTALSLTMAHHGATLVIDAIDPAGTMDERIYNRIGEIFSFQKEYEPYFTGEMVEDAGIYYGIRSRMYWDQYNSCECCRILSQTLIRNHIPFGVTGSFASLDRYPVIFAPALSQLEEKDFERLAQYAENGGTLYLSGWNALAERLTGHRYLRRTEEIKVYLAPTEDWADRFGDFNAAYPLPFDGTAPVVEPGENCDTAATLTLPYTKPDSLQFASIHSDPPGKATDIPMITVHRYGKGRVIWSAVPIEAVPYEEYGRILLSLVTDRVSPSLTTDAPADVELVSFRDGDSLTVSAVKLCENSVSQPVPPFTVTVRTDKVPCRVIRLPDEREIPFAAENGAVTFRMETLSVFGMYRICFRDSGVQ